jgi:hypothetical protein
LFLTNQKAHFDGFEKEQLTYHMHSCRFQTPVSPCNGWTKNLLLQIIASHIIKVHASANKTSGDSRTAKEENWLKRYLFVKLKNMLFTILLWWGNHEKLNDVGFGSHRYIQYCRTECHPRLSESASSRLQNEYVRFRQVFVFLILF